MLKCLKECGGVARCFVLVALLAGCKFPPLPDLDDAASPDASDDAAGDATDASVDGAMCTQTTCSAGTLEVCGTSGTVESTETCRLGCFSNDRCNRVDPSNGLGAQVDGAVGLSAVTLPAGSMVDTDNGVIRSGGQVVAVATETVAQAGGQTLRVFTARSFAIHDTRVTGNMPVAFVAYGDIVLEGILDISADVGVAGPGALVCTGNGRGSDQPGGYWSNRLPGHNGSGQYIWNSAGPGGGGFGSDGAQGGDNSTATGGAGGTANGVAALTPLRGGCPGGGVNSGQVDVGNGGRGGGAVQLVSATGQIVVMGLSPALAGVHAGGSGGRGCDNNGTSTMSPPPGTGCGPGGGGSGGGILLEAASVRFETSSVLLAAGGGGGGSGGCGEPRHGQEAPPNGSTAAGGNCPVETWGTPGPGGSGASASSAQVGGSVTYFDGGGGGGGLGRIRINTVDGNYAGASNLLARGVVTTGTVTTR
jgi:hypothetical protein